MVRDLRALDCIECDEPGDVYTLRIQRLDHGSLTVTLVYCPECADDFLSCDWIEERRREQATP